LYHDKKEQFAMEFPLEYIDFLVHFHGDRDYFECHEILEEFWKEIDSKNKHSIWVGFIQLAVANYHHRRGNFNGALRTLQKSLHIFTLDEMKLCKLGIDPILLFKQMNQELSNIKHQLDYQSMNLPIHSKELVEKCMNRCHELHLEWCKASDLNNLEIVHRHLKRDRTSVINERNRAKRIKGSDF
jgi:uncharacterized protein